jgi:hypothetical protein
MRAERGTKRTCQNDECGARFYDLMRNPIACPVCQTAFVPPPPRVAKPEPAWKNNRNAQRPIVQPAAVAEDEAAAEPEAEEADADDTDIAPDKQDIILEIDEDDDQAVNGVERPNAGEDKS